MFGVILFVLRTLGAGFRPRRELLLENLALRHQLLVLNRNAERPRFRSHDRVGSKNSCGLTVIEFEEAAEAFAGLDLTGGTADPVCCCRE